MSKTSQHQETNTQSANNDACESSGIIHSKELKVLNLIHAFALNAQNSLNKFSPVSAKLRSWLLGSDLNDYLNHQHQFNSSLVRYLNEVARYVDHLDGELSTAIRELKTATSSLARDLGENDSSQIKLNTELQTINSAVKGLESLLSSVSMRSSTATVTTATEQKQDVVIPDCSYLLFENRFRGSEQEIEKRLEIYLPYFLQAKKPVLEIGPGRGEFLTLLKSNNVSAYGVDSDTAMAETCLKKGLDVKVADGIAHLATLEDRSLGGLIATQVIEHLPVNILKELLTLASRKIESGGSLILETINSSSIVALTSNYFRDPTHVAPIHPDTVKFLADISGLDVQEIKYLSPFPKEAVLQEIPTFENLSPEQLQTVNTLNLNVSRLNKLLFGFQDYALIAKAK